MKLFTLKTVAVVDTRAEPEFTRAHIPGAISLAHADISARTPASMRTIDALKKSTRPVVVYCACPAETTSLRVAESCAPPALPTRLTGGWVDWFNSGNRSSRRADAFRP
jgi:3-mercaptopyruvate sulfurtransferase SseA